MCQNLEDLTIQYYTTENLNCAETLIRACNDYYDLKIAPEDFSLMSAFGGGLFTGNLCGALAGPAAALAKMIVHTNAHEDRDRLRPAIVLLTRNFRADMGDTQCAKVKMAHFNPEERCLLTVRKGARVMEKTASELGYMPCAKFSQA